MKFVACREPAAAPVRLDRAVADFGHTAGEGLVRQRVDRDLRPLTELDVRDVGFVDLDLRLDDRHVGERQQDGAGVVHRADYRRFALLDVPAGDDAVDRRFDADLAEIVAGALEAGALLPDPRGLCASPASRALAARTARPGRRSRPSRAPPVSLAARCQSSCWRARFLCA